MSLPAAPAQTSSVAAVADTSCVGATTATVVEKENELKRKNAKISSYYENLRTNVFSLLGKRTSITAEIILCSLSDKVFFSLIFCSKVVSKTDMV